ncbi:MAG: P-loop containing nucleoside triphosphate hydrolase protein [Monoraphidium minutum]|nr:MAG: P-loop containing nucleoside triphosphate hydrolase protein [Monoraphidium minutum]
MSSATGASAPAAEPAPPAAPKPLATAAVGAAVAAAPRAVVTVAAGGDSPGLSPAPSSAASESAAAAEDAAAAAAAAEDAAATAAAGEAVLVIPTAPPPAKPSALPFSPRAAEAREQAEAAAAGAGAAAAAARRALPRLYLSHEHPAVLAAQAGSHPTPPRRGWAARVAMPLALPLLLVYWAAALAAALGAALLVWPSLLLARRLYWACPFIPAIWRGPMRRRFGAAGSLLLRLQFEGAHCVTVVGRLLTLPLRPHLPDFYIAGFPVPGGKCGTTSLASYLKLHLGVSGIAGMPGHEALAKESHFLGGLLGRGAAATSPALYRSCFPTIVTRWWAEAVMGVGRWLCFDATPTYACLPHVPARVKALTPDAKVVFMIREPTAAVFSAECMLRGLGLPLVWSMAQGKAGGGGGYVDVEAGGGAGGADNELLRDDPAHDAFWSRLSALPPGAELPAEMPGVLYRDALSYVRAAQYADRLAEWAAVLPPENLLVVDFKRFVSSPEAVVREVLAFVGADASRYVFRRLPPGMATDYAGATMHSGVRRAVAAKWFAGPNAALWRMLGTDLGWAAAVGAKH